MFSLLARSSSSGEPGIVVLLFILFGVAAIVVWLWSLIHCIRNRNLTDTNRLIGIILIVILGLLGSLIYLLLPRESQAVR